MTIKEIVESALPIAEKYSTDNVATLHRLLKDMDEPTMKVVVLGDFKAGKSTLLNGVFLKEELLPRDHMEATAVPTYVRSGEPLLEIWGRNADGSETLLDTKRDFSAKDIRAHVTAPSQEELGKVAAQYSRVVVQKPGVLPNGITVVDTPGMNSTNGAVCIGTHAEAWSADAVLYVVRSRELTERETRFIATLCGKGINKVPTHIIVTDDGQKSAGALKNIETAIDAKLRSRGVPVTTSLYVFGSGSMLDKAERIWEGFKETARAWRLEPVLDAITQPEPACPDGSAVEGRDILAELSRFFETEVGKGRRARISRDLTAILASLEQGVTQRLSVLRNGTERVGEMENTLLAQEQEYIRVVENLLADVNAAGQRLRNDMAKEFSKIETRLAQQVDAQDSPSAILSQLSSWETTVPFDIQIAIQELSLHFRKDIREIERKYQMRLSAGLNGDMIGVPEFDLGLVAKIPTWLLTVADYIIFDMVSPLPPFVDIPLRWFAGRVPILKSLMPAKLASGAAAVWAKSQLAGVMQECKGKVNGILTERLQELQEKLKEALSSDLAFGSAKKAIEEARSGALTPELRDELESMLNTIKDWGKAM